MRRLIENEIFYCEPFLENEENMQLIQKFRIATETGLGLEQYLKNQAVSDEISHKARTYLVKDNVTNESVGYFSLKTGMVASRKKWNFCREWVLLVPDFFTPNSTKFRQITKSIHYVSY